MPNDTSTQRPTPVPYAAAKAYWEAAGGGSIILQRCAAGHLQFYPRAHCRTCGSTDLGWITATGSGTVHTFSIVYRAGHDGFVDRVPYAFAIVELDEGQRLTSNIINSDVDQVRIGMRVRAVFSDQLGEYTLPQFEPAQSKADQT
jgi:uncharacterized protein